MREKEVHVQPSDLETHSLDWVRASLRIADARSAAATVTTLSPTGFGLLCSFFTPPCMNMGTTALASMDRLKASIDAQGDRIAEVVADFEGTDRAVADNLGHVRSRVW